MTDNKQIELFPNELEYTNHTHTKSSCANGTHLVGYINCSYLTLRSLLGKPGYADGYKVDAEWCLQFRDGTVATIYNWKNGKNYLGEEGLDVEDITEWHIGGASSKSETYVKQLLGLD
jgi:hypothetical protein